MKVLITGGAGFIGGHLAKRLLQEADTQVDLLDNYMRGVADDFLKELTDRPNVAIIECDMLAHGALDALGDDYDYIVHLAAIIGVKHVLERPFDVLRSNEIMMLAAMDLARRQKDLKRFVFASTSEIVAGTLKQYGLDIPTPETTPICMPDPSDRRHTYLLSKLYGEALCHHCGMPFTTFRPHNFYGPRMGLVHVVPELAKKINALPESGELEVFSCEHQRTFCYIEDAVEMVARLMLRQSGANGVFNIGVEKPEVTIRQVAEAVIQAMGKPIVIKEGPTTEGSPARRCPDMSKTIAATEYEPQVSLEQGVQHTLDWYRKNVFESGGVSAV